MKKLGENTASITKTQDRNYVMVRINSNLVCNRRYIYEFEEDKLNFMLATSMDEQNGIKIKDIAASIPIGENEIRLGRYKISDESTPENIIINLTEMIC